MKATVVFGTRPEIIKLGPLIKKLKSRRHSVQIIFTGQHTGLAYENLKIFGINPDTSLRIQRPGQSLLSMSARLLRDFSRMEKNFSSDVLIVQGDTTSAMLGAYFGFTHQVPVAHVEAGLRTGLRYSPFPEEMNRLLITRMASFHFAPTQGARKNLMQEGIVTDNIFVVGNTGIDALYYAVHQLKQEQTLQKTKLILATIHRRENQKSGIKEFIEALKDLAKDPEVSIECTVHPSPKVRQLLHQHLAGAKNVRLLKPLNYFDFVKKLMLASLVITDSGGVQEEAAVLGVPLIIARESTERPEVLFSKTSKIIKPKRIEIVKAARGLLKLRMMRDFNQLGTFFGNGQASLEIVKILEKRLK